MLAAYFQSLGLFDEEEITQIVQLFEYRRLNKNDFFVKENQRCNEVAFITSGIFRSYYTTSSAEDVTYCFRFPNSLIAAYSSFITGGPSIETMQALTPAELWVIKKSTIDKLAAESLVWTKYLRMIAEQQYLELEKRIFQLQKETALQRYTVLLRDQPEFVRQIPLQYLASYLGITQRHLSRIRNEITF
ncbi:Crp/Fnr family transcriptional regulator [Sphingobacterium sp. ML3W]|jgi:cAMP-binding proteins - catabolite gene activator and regulatory subunit of cAMP-dependent protein kinases|uniref:Crp/Fnr family transcriptional regulator n=1 Tax=Sphingobacterium sp. ML3W TaxID=1538644 RepID=UPI00249B3A37|nr:Crp/Fnr family transcriptional regulator [Sphingobacterium sp. ML3W]WFA79358.1 Crp/Fnr family transcriptional regulator [Sphingobacterium sp. ML3W]